MSMYTPIYTTGEMLDPPIGKGWILVDELPWTEASRSVLEGANPPAIMGDVLEWDLVTFPSSFDVIMNPDGTFELGPDDDETYQTFNYRLWRTTDSTWAGPAMVELAGPGGNWVFTDIGVLEDEALIVGDTIDGTLDATEDATDDDFDAIGVIGYTWVLEAYITNVEVDSYTLSGTLTHPSEVYAVAISSGDTPPNIYQIRNGTDGDNQPAIGTGTTLSEITFPYTFDDLIVTGPDITDYPEHDIYCVARKIED